MEIQKVLIKTAYCLVGISILVLIGISLFQYQLIKKLSENAPQETVVKDESTGELIPFPVEAPQKSEPQDTTFTNKEIDELEYQLDAAEEELDMAQDQLSEELSKKAEISRNAIELQKKMLQDPAYKKMLRNTFKGQLDSTYGSLFSKLNLSSEKLGQLKELLTDQMMSLLDINQEMLGVTPSEEKREELQQRITDLKEENDAEISALLGSQDFQTYESYRETLSERQVVEMFSESLSEGDKLTEAQKESFIDSIYRERKNVYSQQGWAEERVTFPSERNDEGIIIMMDMIDRTHDGYIKGAADTLSATQMEQFKTYLKNQRDMTESSLKISAQIYGGQAEQKSADETSE